MTSEQQNHAKMFTISNRKKNKNIARYTVYGNETNCVI